MKNLLGIILFLTIIILAVKVGYSRPENSLTTIDSLTVDTLAVDTVSIEKPQLTAQEKAIIEKYVTQLGISDSLINNPYLYVLIDEWIGTKYKYGGNSKSGTDCSGFVGQILKHFTDATYPRSAAGMSQVVEVKKKEDLQEGDLVFFNLRNIPNKHVGIYLHNGYFVHASSVNGVTISNLNATTYLKRFSKCGSIKWTAEN